VPSVKRFDAHVRCAVTVAIVATLAACTPKIDVAGVRDPARASAGALYSIEPIRTYPALALRAWVAWQGLSDRFPIAFGFSLYRLRYWTTGVDGKLTVASGLVAFPRADDLRAVVSFQHGTASERASAPSTPDASNGILAAAAFAGRGYLLVAPDYIGLGASTESHPYMQAESEASAVVDLLRAAHEIVAVTGKTWPSTLLLVGFSQGGHATLAAQRALEAAPIDGLTVSGAASIAGPFDLAGMSFPFALEGRSHASSLYLAYMLDAYSRTYDEPLASALREPYAANVPGLFDGAHDGDAIEAALPTRPREMFNDDFLASYASGGTNWLRERLAENSLYDWSPQAPIRLYFGKRDGDVSPEEAQLEAERLTARGGNVAAIDIGDVDHEGSVLPAVPLVLAWFDSLSEQR
jgi:pimeloyl-ACP methyl ester carboxylesterase